MEVRRSNLQRVYSSYFGSKEMTYWNRIVHLFLFLFAYLLPLSSTIDIFYFLFILHEIERFLYPFLVLTYCYVLCSPCLLSTTSRRSLRFPYFLYPSSHLVPSHHLLIYNLSIFMASLNSLANPLYTGVFLGLCKIFYTCMHYKQHLFSNLTLMLRIQYTNTWIKVEK